MAIAFNINTAINGEINQIDRRGLSFKSVEVNVPVGENSTVKSLSFGIIPSHAAIQINSMVHEVVSFHAIPTLYHPFTVEVSGVLRSTVVYLDETAATQTDILDTPFSQTVAIPGVKGKNLIPNVSIYITNLSESFQEDPHVFPGIHLWIQMALNIPVQALQPHKLLEKKK